ncbi:uncharacterized protein LOC135816624 [Sycon ciliatum]|uniref:uncharacterized protein LOC135816624 n=1 Tax=Sycon ciliatum TaxID=27933 RepID=UPI0031F6B7A2
MALFASLAVACLFLLVAPSYGQFGPTTKCQYMDCDGFDYSKCTSSEKTCSAFSKGYCVSATEYDATVGFQLKWKKGCDGDFTSNVNCGTQNTSKHIETSPFDSSVVVVANVYQCCYGDNCNTGKPPRDPGAKDPPSTGGPVVQSSTGGGGPASQPSTRGPAATVTTSSASWPRGQLAALVLSAAAAYVMH